MAKQTERENAILHACESSAYRDKGYYLISFFELASTLNNFWYARLFVSKKSRAKLSLGNDKEFWAVEEYNLPKFRWGISFTINRMKGAKTITQKYGVFYRIPIHKSIV